MMNKVASQVVMMATAIAALTACSKGAGSFSILKDGDDYKQEAVFVPKKVDILWVIDNSGSMKTSQDNLASSFSSFINRFQTQGFDFRMAVTTTEAWARQFDANSTLSMIKDGAVLQKNPKIETHSGYYVMDQNTPNLVDVFAINAKQGTIGNGDERPLESMKQTLLDSRNSAFRRADAFLAVIMVSDEEDSSGPSSDWQSNGTFYTPQSYVDFLNSLSGSGNFNVSVITVDSNDCRTQLNTDGFNRTVSTRMPELADLTKGIKASLCGNFGTSLDVISNNIITLSSVFKLSREPDLSTLKVYVDGVQIAEDPVNGYTYDPAEMTITFHGTSAPGANSSVKIDYYPIGLEN